MYMSSTLYRLFGFNVSWSRLPSAIAGVILIVVVYFIARELFREKQPFFQVLVCYSPRQYCCETGLSRHNANNVYIYWSFGVHKGIKKQKLLATCLDIFWFGFLNKRLCLPYIANGVSFSHDNRKQTQESIRTKEFWIGLVSSAVIILPWHIANILVNGSTFVQSYFGYHILKRSGEAIEGHQGGVLFYPKLFMKVYLPWIFVLPFSILLGIKRPQAIKWPRSSIL